MAWHSSQNPGWSDSIFCHETSLSETAIRFHQLAPADRYSSGPAMIRLILSGTPPETYLYIDWHWLCKLQCIGRFHSSPWPVMPSTYSVVQLTLNGSDLIVRPFPRGSPDFLVSIEIYFEVKLIDTKCGTYQDLQELYSSSSCDEDTTQCLDSIVFKQ